MFNVTSRIYTGKLLYLLYLLCLQKSSLHFSGNAGGKWNNTNIYNLFK